MRLLFNSLLKGFITFTLSLYFRKWIVAGVDKIPRRQPVIFASNHQNAFLDALVITCSSNRLPYYLARAEVFGSKFARYMLGLIRIMPIYRFRDGIGNVKKNDAILETCMNLLSKNQSLVIFPEGNHADQWTIRTLQRGLSRIALPAEESSDWKLGINLVPVGIQYEEPKSFRSRLLVTFGESIAVSDYKDAYLQNNRNGFDLLKVDLQACLKQLVVHIPEEGYSDVHRELMAKRPYLKDYAAQVALDKELVDAIIHKKEIVLPAGQRKRILNPISYILGAWSYINNYVPYLLTRSFIKAKIKDPVFTGSIKLACGVVIAPVFHFFVGVLLSISIGIWWIGALYVFSQPIAGYFGGFDVLRKI